MNDIEKIRILSRGLKAALRWPYTGEMLDHIKNPTLMEGHNYDPYQHPPSASEPTGGFLPHPIFGIPAIPGRGT